LNILLKQIKKNVSKDKELITPITNHLVMTRKGQPIVHKLHEKVADYGNSIKAQEALLERLLNVENEIVVTEKKVTKKEAEVKKKEQEKKNTGITLEDWKKNKRPNGYVRTTPMIEKARRHKLKPEQELPAKIQNSYQNLLDNLKNNGKLTKAESKKIAELSQKVSSILELKMELQVLKPNLNVFLNILTKTRDSSYRQALAEFGSLLNEEYRSKLYEIAKTPDKIKPENIIKNINDVLRELDKKVKDKKSKLREVLK